MMTGYAARYTSEDFEVVALEKTFTGTIINPTTGAASRILGMAGKIDGIVRRGNEYYLLEHKTASQVDGSYLERLSSPSKPLVLNALLLCGEEIVAGVTPDGASRILAYKRRRSCDAADKGDTRKRPPPCGQPCYGV